MLCLAINGKVTIMIIIHTFLYRRKVVTSEAVAEEVGSRLSLSVIMSQVEQVSFKPRFNKKLRNRGDNSRRSLCLYADAIHTASFGCSRVYSHSR